MVHTEGFQARQHAVSGGTRFAERRVAQLPVELGWKMSTEVDAAVPDGCDLAQIKLALFISKRETLVCARCAVVSRETHFSRIAIGVKADCVAALARDGLSHSRDAVVIVAVCDDEN